MPPSPLSLERDDALWKRAAPRALRLLGGHAGGPGAESAGGGGPATLPNEQDALRIAARIRAAGARPSLSQPGLLGLDAGSHARAIADDLVRRARGALLKLDSSGVGSLDDADTLALESVLMVRGRPALRVEGNRLEALDEEHHPGSGFWRILVSDHENDLATVAAATAGVVVRSTDSDHASVVGSAWLVRDDLAVTNRHVLFPPTGGQALATRPSRSATTASLAQGLDVSLDFAFDDGPPRSRKYRILNIPLVSAHADPIDVALLRVQPQSVGDAVTVPPLALRSSAFGAGQLYIVGHPGRVLGVPPEVLTVFGILDERKRVSLGTLMNSLPGRPGELIHDASTTGGYSGGCLVGFFSREVAGLHYFGDPIAGNRAFTAKALREHPVATFF